jgi:hypothetical protein
VAVDPKKIKLIEYWPALWKVSEVRSSMGLDKYYKGFLKGFSKIFHPIISLQRKGKKFVRSTECEASFQQLKNLLTNAPVLKIVDPIIAQFVLAQNIVLSQIPRKVNARLA